MNILKKINFLKISFGEISEAEFENEVSSQTIIAEEVICNHDYQFIKDDEILGMGFYLCKLSKN